MKRAAATALILAAVLAAAGIAFAQEDLTLEGLSVRLEGLVGRVDTHEKRLAALETAIAPTPTLTDEADIRVVFSNNANGELQVSAFASFAVAPAALGVIAYSTEIIHAGEVGTGKAYSVLGQFRFDSTNAAEPGQEITFSHWAQNNDCEGQPGCNCEDKQGLARSGCEFIRDRRERKDAVKAHFPYAHITHAMAFYVGGDEQSFLCERVEVLAEPETVFACRACEMSRLNCLGYYQQDWTSRR